MCVCVGCIKCNLVEVLHAFMLVLVLKEMDNEEYVLNRGGNRSVCMKKKKECGVD